ncbi:MAG: ThuA domain-containing protein [Myxococcota bacterium]|nr:ThuA domain-containing protein [Myxococcota bacterium]
MAAGDGANAAAGRPAAVDAALVVGGRYHDFDYARLRLLELLAELPEVRVRVWPDYADVDAIASCRFLVSYTCDVRPDPARQEGLARFVADGGRWLALHGTHAALDFTPEGVAAPDVMPRLVHVLGSRFVAHPPIAPYRVEPSDPEHPLVAGVGAFETDDELYLMELPEPEALVPLLETRFAGEAPGFVVRDWRHADRHLVSYLRPYGRGAVLYNTLGHCRGHHDMRPVMDWYPRVERGSWERPAFRELLRRGLRWARGEEIG